MTPIVPRFSQRQAARQVANAARDLANARLIQAIAVAQAWASGTPIRVNKLYGFHTTWLGYPPPMTSAYIFAKCRQLAIRGHVVVDASDRVYATDEGRSWAWRIGGPAS